MSDEEAEFAPAGFDEDPKDGWEMSASALSSRRADAATPAVLAPEGPQAIVRLAEQSAALITSALPIGTAPEGLEDEEEGEEEDSDDEVRLDTGDDSVLASATSAVSAVDRDLLSQLEGIKEDVNDDMVDRHEGLASSTPYHEDETEVSHAGGSRRPHILELNEDDEMVDAFTVLHLDNTTPAGPSLSGHNTTEFSQHGPATISTTNSFLSSQTPTTFIPYTYISHDEIEMMDHHKTDTDMNDQGSFSSSGEQTNISPVELMRVGLEKLHDKLSADILSVDNKLETVLNNWNTKIEASFDRWNEKIDASFQAWNQTQLNMSDRTSAKLSDIDNKMDAVDNKMNVIDSKMNAIEIKINDIENKLVTKEEFHTAITDIHARHEADLKKIETRLKSLDERVKYAVEQGHKDQEKMLEIQTAQIQKLLDAQITQIQRQFEDVSLVKPDSTRKLQIILFDIKWILPSSLQESYGKIPLEEHLTAQRCKRWERFESIANQSWRTQMQKVMNDAGKKDKLKITHIVVTTEPPQSGESQNTITTSRAYSEWFRDCVEAGSVAQVEVEVVFELVAEGQECEEMSDDRNKKRKVSET